MPVNSVTMDMLLRDRQFVSAGKRVVRSMEAMRARMQAVSAHAKRMLLVGGGAVAGMVALAAKQERAEVQLDAALKTSGASLVEWSQRMRDAASAIQELTTYGDEAVMPMMALALNLGVTADKLEDATRMGLGLAKALGTDATAGIRNYTLALNGQYQMLSRYVPAIRTATNQQEKLAIVTGLAAKGFNQLEEDAKTFFGRLIQLKNLLGDVGEKIGTHFIPSLERAIKAVRDFLPHMEHWIETTGKQIVQIAKWGAIVAASTIILTKFVGAVVAVTKIVGVLKVAIVKLMPVLVGTGEVFVTLSKGAGAAGVAIGLLASEVVRAKREIREMNEELEKSLAVSREQAVAWEAMYKARVALRTAEETGDTKEQIKASEQLLKATRSNIKAINAGLKEVGAIAPVEVTGQLIEAFDALGKTLDGLDERIAMLRQRLTSEQRKPRTREYAEQTDAEKELAKAIADTTKKLEDEVATFGMAARQIEVYRLAQRGATGDQLLQLRLRMRELSKLERIEAEIEAASKQRYADAEARGVAKNVMYDEAERYRSMTRTAAERVTIELQRVEALRQANALTDQEAAAVSQILQDRIKERETRGLGIEGLTATWRRTMSAAAGRRSAANAPNSAQLAIQQAANASIGLMHKMLTVLAEIQAKVSPVGVWGI